MVHWPHFWEWVFLVPWLVQSLAVHSLAHREPQTSQRLLGRRLPWDRTAKCVGITDLGTIFFVFAKVQMRTPIGGNTSADITCNVVLLWLNYLPSWRILDGMFKTDFQRMCTVEKNLCKGLQFSLFIYHRLYAVMCNNFRN